jgi:hypothetical protein
MKAGEDLLVSEIAVDVTRAHRGASCGYPGNQGRIGEKQFRVAYKLAKGEKRWPTAIRSETARDCGCS